MPAEELVRQYLSQIKIMQLATSVDDQPWSCTIHYYTDKDLNFYWISTLAREHSQHIARNPKVAAAILVHENTAAEDYIIGLSVSGVAELLGSQVEDAIGRAYVTKLNRDPKLLSDIASGKNLHKFYRLRPSRIVLFDNKNFPDSPRLDVKV
jgi:uncharacterized protein YhbP (UPF0306 family)